MDIGQILLALRKERGLYQKEVAFALNLSVGTISNYEQGRHYPDPDTMCRLADFYGVTTDYLLGRTSFQYDPGLLNRPLTENYTIADLVNTSLELSPRNKHSLVDYIELLKLREQADGGS